MGKITWRGIRQHPIRFALSVLAVVLGIAFLAGTLSLRTMLSSTFSDIIETSEDADAYIRAAQAGADRNAAAAQSVGGVDLALADTVASLPEVSSARPAASGPMVLVGKDGTAVRNSQAPSYALAIWPDDPAWRWISGSIGQDIHHIVLEERTAETAELSVGDETTIVLGGEVVPVTITGIVAFEGPTAGATFVGLDPATAISLFAPTNQVPEIALFAAKGVSESQLQRAATAALDDSSLTVLTGNEVRQAAKDSIDSILGFVSAFLLIFAAIALFVGAFIISNTFTMIVRQRMREIAVLRAIGASTSQVFATVVGQAAIVGLVGSAIGILGGFGLIEIIRVVLSTGMGMDLGDAIPLTGATIAWSMVIGTLVAIAASALPAAKAARTPPVEAMATHDAPQQRPSHVRTAIGAALLVGSVAAVILAVGSSSPSAPLVGVGAAGVVFGALIISPALIRPGIWVLAWPAATMLAPMGGLARGTVTQNPRRAANTAGALMIGMALVGAVSVLAASTQASVASQVDQDLKADYILDAGLTGVPVGAVDAVAALPSVAHADSVLTTTATVDGLAGTLAGIPAELFDRDVNVRVIDGDLAALAHGDAIVKSDTADDQGWHVGDTVDIVSTATGAPVTTRVRIGAVFESAAFNVAAMVGEQLYNELVPEQARRFDTVMVTTAPGHSASIRHDLTAAVAPYKIISVMDQGEYQSSLAQQVDQVLAVLYALLGLSIVIAVLGIVNTLALSIMERTREIGLLRAVGLGRFQLSTQVIIESILIAVFGTVAGLGIGVGLAAALPTVFADMGLKNLSIPWGQLGVLVAVAVFVGVLAAVGPAIRAARLPVLEAVVDE